MSRRNVQSSTIKIESALNTKMPLENEKLESKSYKL